MPTIPITWYAIAALVVSNLVTGWLWQSASHELELIDLRGQLAAKDTERKIKEQQQITEDTKNGWSAALDVVRSDYSRRLRNAGAPAMPGLSQPANGVDGIPANALALAGDCAETTLMLVKLQEWASKQGAVR